MSSSTRLPWVLALEFSNKKLAGQNQWMEIAAKLEQTYERNFEINEERGFREFEDK
jgi:hypothetical protein